MFQTLITILTASTFVAHGLFGCCWHHGHPHWVGGCGTVHQTAAVRDDDSACCRGRHVHDHREANAQAADRDQGSHPDAQTPAPARCDEGQCVFARAQDTAQSCEDVSLAAALFVAVVIPGDVLPAPAAEATAFAASEPAARSSAPLCALCQVRLI